MKNLFKKSKNIKKTSLISSIDQILEHRLFKPITIAVITSFILFKGFEQINGFVADYKESKSVKTKATPIKINFSNQEINFDLKEEQVGEYIVAKGDTMMEVLLNVGAPDTQAFAILEAMKKYYNPRLITAGSQILVKYKLKIDFDSSKKDGQNITRKALISEVTVFPSPELEVRITRQNDGSYTAKEIKIKLTKKVTKYAGVIKSGLFVDGTEAGISPNAVMNMINLYSFDVDFQRDIHDGDKFEMLAESYYNEDGKKVKDGNVLFSSLTLNGKEIAMYGHKVADHLEYFDAKGNSVKKSLLRTPVNGARISSGFGFRRHPILGYSKLHKGVDFAAPSGTPIFAAGGGTITYYGRKGGYGNFVQIKHNSEYSTAYGHASRFAKKLKVGSKVKQGEVVAYVGSTGRSTGPHLHFEVLYKGSAINPAKVKATSGLRLAGKELARFNDSKAEIERLRK